jgi:hypothetical protein
MEEIKNGSPATQESGPLAREMAAAYRAMVAHYKKQYNLSPQEALAKNDEPLDPAVDEHVRQTPPGQASWYDLQDLTNRDPDLAVQAWENIKNAALEELQSGHRAAVAVDGCYGSPWDRARFLALRADLASNLEPRNGIEWQLIDTMAQAQAFVLSWMATLMGRMTIDTRYLKKHMEERAPWEPPRLSEAETMDQASAMVDRFNRIFLRTLRALQELRRHTPMVLVQNARQVNVGERQVNLTENSADSACRCAAEKATPPEPQESAGFGEAANGTSKTRRVRERQRARFQHNGAAAGH